MTEKFDPRSLSTLGAHIDEARRVHLHLGWVLALGAVLDLLRDMVPPNPNLREAVFRLLTEATEDSVQKYRETRRELHEREKVSCT